MDAEVDTAVTVLADPTADVLAEDTTDAAVIAVAGGGTDKYSKSIVTRELLNCKYSCYKRSSL